MTSNTKAGAIQTTPKQKCKKEEGEGRDPEEIKKRKDTFIKRKKKRHRIKQVQVQERVIHKKKASILHHSPPL